MKFQIELDLPAELVDRETERQLVAACQEEVVLRLFGDHKIPSSVAARLLGMGRVAFMDLARRRGLPYIVAEADDLERDLQVIEDYRRRHNLGLPDERRSR
jgi:predicted HTH domain antitoxin